MSCSAFRASAHSRNTRWSRVTVASQTTPWVGMSIAHFWQPLKRCIYAGLPADYLLSNHTCMSPVLLSDARCVYNIAELTQAYAGAGIPDQLLCFSGMQDQRCTPALLFLRHPEPTCSLNEKPKRPPCSLYSVHRFLYCWSYICWQELHASGCVLKFQTLLTCQ